MTSKTELIPDAITEQQKAELIRLKAYFPFRIVFGVLATDGSFQVYANTDKRIMNKLARQGNQVFQLG